MAALRAATRERRRVNRRRRIVPDMMVQNHGRPVATFRTSMNWRIAPAGVHEIKPNAERSPYWRGGMVLSMSGVDVKSRGRSGTTVLSGTDTSGIYGCDIDDVEASPACEIDNASAFTDAVSNGFGTDLDGVHEKFLDAEIPMTDAISGLRCLA